MLLADLNLCPLAAAAISLRAELRNQSIQTTGSARFKI